MLEAVCPNGHRLHVPAEHAGMKLRCPACNVVFQLTQAGANPGSSGIGKAAANPGSSGIGKGGAAASPPIGPLPDANAGTPSQPLTAPSNPSAEASANKWSGAEPLSPVGSSNGGGTSISRTPPPPPNLRSTSPPVGASGIYGPPPTDWQAQVRLWTQPVLVVGLMLVLGARGCDGLAAKNISRLKSRADLEQRVFDEEREQALLDVQVLLDAPNVPAARKAELQKQHEEVQHDFDTRRRDLQKGEWREMTNAAGRADAENRVEGYWREMWFVVGSLLFSLGLLTTALLGQGADRWISFGLLAIVIFSIYIGGSAWTASLYGILGR